MKIGYLGKQDSFALEMLRQMKAGNPEDEFLTWLPGERAPAMDLEVLLAVGKMGAEELARVRKEQNQIDLDDTRFEAIFGQRGRLRRLLPENITIGLYNIHERSYGEVVEKGCYILLE